MIQTVLFDAVGAIRESPLHTRQTIPPPNTGVRDNLPRRITWQEHGKTYRGRPWHFGCDLWRVIITHSPKGYDIGWNRFVDHKTVKSARP